MKYRRLLFVCIILSFLSAYTNAQQIWNLKTIVDYAMANNINVKLSEVQNKISAVNYNQNTLSQFPTLSLAGSSSLNSGSNQNPATFTRITQSYVGINLQLQSSADIFNFFSKQNALMASKWELDAAKANVDKLKNDIALTVANGYLQVLLAKEQLKIMDVQVLQTTNQLFVVRKQVSAGTLPELNAVQLEAQLANDSINYISAKGNYEQSILQLKSFMNVDAAAPFELETPPVELIPVEPIADLQPDVVYQLAKKNQPLQRVNDFRLRASQKNVLSAKASMLPTLSAFGSLGTIYNDQVLKIDSRTPASTPIGSVSVSGTDYIVYQPSYNFSYSKTPIATQFSDNFRQSIGLSLNIPLANGGALKSNYLRSKLNVETAQLQLTADDQKLKQDIFQAYNSALVALEKFNASRKNVMANELSYNYAGKRYTVGMLSNYDLITTQNNLLTARLQFTINQFDYVFKMKVLEFYKGLGLKL